MVVVYTAKFHYVYRLIVEHPILSMPRDNLQNIKKIKRVKNNIFTLKNMDVFNRKKALKNSSIQKVSGVQASPLNVFSKKTC